VEPIIHCRDLLLRLGDDEILVLDCRPEDQCRDMEVQIPGALWISSDDLAHAAQSLPDDELIVVYGASRDAHARRAVRLLRLRGFDAVMLDGGLRTWISLGFPTERAVSGRPAAIPSVL
jgi:rhodanese-related sulfurtransferase